MLAPIDIRMSNMILMGLEIIEMIQIHRNSDFSLRFLKLEEKINSVEILSY